MEIQVEEKTKNALLWITEILNRHNIPFQICGGLAAKLYGSPRPLNDIDIEEVKEYIIFGPEQYLDEKWDLWLMTLNYFGQEIDIGGAIHLKIFDSQHDVWVPFPVDFAKVAWVPVAGIKVPVITKEDLIIYKSLLDGDHQQVDIIAVRYSMK
jgi:predicted nucleotidyltransferase